MPLIESLTEANVRSVGTSAGGRDILAVEYGAREVLDARCDNLASAVASGTGGPEPGRLFPPAFYGSARRRRPVIILQGAIHGGELTGTVASLNLCRVIETGADLRGREWPHLRELARASRLVIVPWLNIDGVERWPIPNCAGAPEELYQR